MSTTTTCKEALSEVNAGKKKRSSVFLMNVFGSLPLSSRNLHGVPSHLNRTVSPLTSLPCLSSLSLRLSSPAVPPSHLPRCPSPKAAIYFVPTFPFQYALPTALLPSFYSAFFYQTRSSFLPLPSLPAPSSHLHFLYCTLDLPSRAPLILSSLAPYTASLQLVYSTLHPLCSLSNST